MKRKSHVVLWSCGLLVMMLIGLGCGQVGQVVEVPSEVIRNFYNNAKNITPEFKPLSTSSSSLKALGWGSGYALYHVFYALREFLPARDEGVIDRGNMYKLLYDVDALFSGAKSLAATLESAKVIIPPYNFGNNKTYTKAGSSESEKRAIALNETDTTLEAIVTWIWTTSSITMETGVFEAVFNKITKDLTVDFVFSVDYNTDDTICDYNQRAKISGNADTHTFEYKFTSGGSKESYALIQMVGKGISKGTGNKMLFKVKHNEDSQFLTTRYLVISAEATEDILKAIDAASDTTTEAGTLPVEVDGYKNYVTGEAFFTFSDLLTDRKNLNQGTTNEGTIYLNY